LELEIVHSSVFRPIKSGNEIEYRETDEKSRDVFKRNNSEPKISHTETITVVCLGVVEITMPSSSIIADL
jgi:hypothetical protein